MRSHTIIKVNPEVDRGMYELVQIYILLEDRYPAADIGGAVCQVLDHRNKSSSHAGWQLQGTGNIFGRTCRAVWVI